MHMDVFQVQFQSLLYIAPKASMVGGATMAGGREGIILKNDGAMDVFNVGRCLFLLMYLAQKDLSMVGRAGGHHFGTTMDVLLYKVDGLHLCPVYSHRAIYMVKYLLNQAPFISSSSLSRA
mgnify:CR=1 FL=1